MKQDVLETFGCDCSFLLTMQEATACTVPSCEIYMLGNKCKGQDLSQLQLTLPELYAVADAT